MAPTLYKMDVSPPVRSVYLTSKALGITLDHVEVNVLQQDHLKPDFLKLNPQHTIPTLEDQGKVIWDSHAINVYLVTKYGKDDSLYPKDPYKRAVIDQMLHFDSGILFANLRSVIKSMKYLGAKTVPQNLTDEIIQAYEFMEKFLEGHRWMAGDSLTLADLSMLATTTSLDVLVPIDSSKYPNITAWIKRGQELPYYEVNRKGLGDLRTIIQKLMA